MPATGFFDRHRDEIQEALKPKATWGLLRDHAVPKLALVGAMTERECKSHGYPGTVQFIDPEMQQWRSVDIPSVRWFDSRDQLRKVLLESKEDFERKVAKNLAYYKAAAVKDPSPRHAETLNGYENFIRYTLPARLSQFEAQTEETRRWLAKLEATPDFAKTLFTLIRESENEVRAAHGVAAVGAAWVSETELLYRVRAVLPGVEVVAHGQPPWLGRQHLDIWIPSMAVALEYHGIQHFQPVEFFGGEDGFQRVQKRDQRKRALCRSANVRLVEVIYDQGLDDAQLVALLRGEGPSPMELPSDTRLR